MKICLFTILVLSCISEQSRSIGWFKNSRLGNATSIAVSQDSAPGLINLLNNLALNSDNTFFKQHCTSIINVIKTQKEFSGDEVSLLDEIYTSFSDSTVLWNAGKLSSYVERKRPFIISWTSPTDSVVSLGWLILPENWNLQQSYPLYVRLHGLSDVYDTPIKYLSYYFKPDSIINATFEDGYTFLPWGRGNLWFTGIADTDVWEGITVLEKLINVNSALFAEIMMV